MIDRITAIYEDKNGNKYYIKHPKSTDHVINELLAGKMYNLAYARTMDYVPVEGGEHVATKLSHLDKKNVADFTEAEKVEARNFCRSRKATNLIGRNGRR